MKTPHSTLYRYSGEAIAEANRIPIGTMAEQSHKRGMEAGEPLIILMDCLLKYAEAHRTAFESLLAEDYVLGPQWLTAAASVRRLLDGNGAVANLKEIPTDTKDNGAVESLFWSALAMAGFTEDDLNNL